jgi:hypothetical protein
MSGKTYLIPTGVHTNFELCLKGAEIVFSVPVK